MFLYLIKYKDNTTMLKTIFTTMTLAVTGSAKLDFEAVHGRTGIKLMSETPEGRNIANSHCTTKHKDQLYRSLEHAKEYLYKARKHLHPDDPIYKKWFGVSNEKNSDKNLKVRYLRAE